MLIEIKIKFEKFNKFNFQTSRIYVIISGSVTVVPWSLTDLNNLTSCGSARGELFSFDCGVNGSDSGVSSNQSYSFENEESTRSDLSKSDKVKPDDCQNFCIRDSDENSVAYRIIYWNNCFDLSSGTNCKIGFSSAMFEVGAPISAP